MKLQVFIILILSFFIFLSLKNNPPLKKPLINDYYNYIATNEIKMWISNNGQGSYNPNPVGPGLYWPGGVDATQTAVWSDGLVWGGYVEDSLSVNGNAWKVGLQAGKILPDGTADNPDLSKYRVYKIRRDWESLPYGPERNAYELDYYDWPVEDGAPWIDIDGDSVYTPGVDEPDISGDEMLWYVNNDLDSVRSMKTYASPPIGIECQVSTYSYKDEGLLGDVIFKKYLLINKSENTVRDMILSYWVDFDLGEAADDFVGGDSLLDLGFGYNGINEDQIYGSPPPAIGYHLLQGPIIEGSAGDSAFFEDQWRKGYKNLPMTSFAPIVKHWYSGMHQAEWGTREGAREMNNNMRGLGTWTGLPLEDPNTGELTTFGVCGDPAAGTGWYEGDGWPGGEDPGDRHMQVNSGPFTFAPGDSNEIVLAIVMAIGDDNLDSVTELKKNVTAIREFYYTGNISNVDRELFSGPIKYSLHQNYPNPFNPTTMIEFSIPISENVQINVFNITGQKVRTLLNKKMLTGTHSVEFNAHDFASGIYFYQIQTGSFRDVKKMIVIK